MKKQSLSDWMKIIVPNWAEVFTENYKKAESKEATIRYLGNLSLEEVQAVSKMIGVQVSDSKLEMVINLIDFKYKED